MFYNKKIAYIALPHLYVVIFLIGATQNHHRGIAVLTYILHHTVIIEQHDINLSPKNKVEIAHFPYGHHIAAAYDRLHTIAAYPHDTAVGTDKRNVYRPDQTIARKHHAAPHTTGRYIDIVHLSTFPHIGTYGRRRQRNSLAVLRRRHIEYISRSTEQPLFRDSQPHNYFVDEGIIDGQLAVHVLREIGAVGLNTIGKLILGDLQNTYQFPDSSYKYIVGHSGIFLLDFPI